MMVMVNFLKLVLLFNAYDETLQTVPSVNRKCAAYRVLMPH